MNASSIDRESSYVDLQINGYLGIDFNDPEATTCDLERAAAAMREDGVVAALPTVITASPDAMLRCIHNLVHAIRDSELVAQIFKGIHVEGPFISPVSGYIGAHPVEHACAPNLALLDRFIEAGCGHLRLLTLAPEVDQEASLTRHCVERGICVAAGHTDASVEQLACSIEAGLSLFTHLGNGCPRLMDRHDNIIFRGLAFADQIHISVIADGFHIPETLFAHFLRVIPREHLIVVSDAISAAGLGVGTYQLGGRSVTIGSDGAARDSSGEHFVGSASTLRQADSWLQACLGLSQAARRELLFHNPARFLGLEEELG